MKNKGFSLVELIIVIAIMAILSAALAPALIRYIDKSKKADDVASAEAMETAFRAAMAEEKIYTTVMDHHAEVQKSPNTTTILLASEVGDEEWVNVTDNEEIDELKAVMDKTCPPEVLRFKKKVTASDSTHSNSMYCIATYGEFTPNGWCLGITQEDELCVFVTNGSKDSSIQGVALNPIACKDYKK